MQHKGCGGGITSGPGAYMYTDEDGVKSIHPALFCDKCGAEILGDSMIELPKEMEEIYAWRR